MKVRILYTHRKRMEDWEIESFSEDKSRRLDVLWVKEVEKREQRGRGNQPVLCRLSMSMAPKGKSVRVGWRRNFGVSSVNQS